MGEISLSELIARTEKSIRPLKHSQSTLYQYRLGWQELSAFFFERDQVLFSKVLTEHYILEAKAKWNAGEIKKWRFKLFRRTAEMLIWCFEDENFTWKYHKEDPWSKIHQESYILLLKNYLAGLNKEGKSDRTIQYYETLARQFLEYLEQKNVTEIAEVRLKDVSLFLPFISKQYQPTSMRTVLSALRSFLRFVESTQPTQICLSVAVPSSSGRKTVIIPTITLEEERKLLLTKDCKTPLEKRNYAMMLLALRTGLRSIDLTNLKLENIDWKKNTLSLVQTKTGVPIVLPLLTDVGNAIADYILNARPPSNQPYVFLNAHAPFQKLSGRSSCYGISCVVMKKAGIRQGKDDRKGFHFLRHSLAARLLSEETPLPVISSILGHRDKDSTKVYLSTDLAHLRACALGLTGIEITLEELR